VTPALPPLSLYVHFPWCVRKCPYCDFNSHTLQGDLPQSDYLEVLLRDLDEQAEAALGRVVQSVFLGGGTPSLFAPETLAALLEGVRTRLGLASDAEVTLEANPGTLERGAFADYRAAGITRVSLGAQSFSHAQLERLGRIHRVEETRRAAAELHAAGLSNFNLDLMYALPQQSAEEALADIEAALALEPAHLSHYELTLEPGTLFAARPPARLPDTDAAAEMQQLCQQRLEAAGFARYEVSAYARQAARCRHNLNYWHFGDYLGIGAGAHGKCTRWLEAALCIERRARVREPRRYLSERHELTRVRVAQAQLPFEYCMNALRLVEGFEASEFEQRTGLTLAAVRPSLDRAVARGQLQCTEGRWRASARGFDLLNELLIGLLPDAAGHELYAQRGEATSTNS
jgi:putative oxygen-independent coproporphyrinogen III oxidase